jgi:RimJ/RimL family protein N-acetyltransferase
MSELDGESAVFATTARLRLRRFEERDIDTLLAYRNDPAVARYQSWDAFTRQEAEALIAEQGTVAPGTPGRWLQLAVELAEDGALVGDCALHVREEDRRLGEVGFTFARQHQGRGLASEAMQALLELAFATIGLHRLAAVVDTANAPAIRLLERLGFRREGHFRQHVWFKGAWGDEYVYALLASDWRRAAGNDNASP